MFFHRVRRARTLLDRGRDGVKGMKIFPAGKQKRKAKRMREEPEEKMLKASTSRRTIIPFCFHSARKKKKKDSGPDVGRSRLFGSAECDFISEKAIRSAAENALPTHPRRVTNARSEFLPLIARRRRTDVFLNTLSSISTYMYKQRARETCSVQIRVRVSARSILRSPCPPLSAIYSKIHPPRADVHPFTRSHPHPTTKGKKQRRTMRIG